MDYDYGDEVPIRLKVILALVIFVSGGLATEGLTTRIGFWSTVVLLVTLAHVLAYTLAYSFRKGWNKAEIF
jgi:hypothetical protein